MNYGAVNRLLKPFVPSVIRSVLCSLNLAWKHGIFGPIVYMQVIDVCQTVSYFSMQAWHIGPGRIYMQDIAACQTVSSLVQ